MTSPEHAPEIFIVGTPRSGTTLMRLLIDSHPDVAIAPESAFLFRIGPKLLPLYGNIRTQRQALSFIEDISQITRVRDWYPSHTSPQDIYARIDTGGPASFSKIVSAIYRQYAEQRGKPRWGDKTPRNLQCIPTILENFPNGRVLVVIRDPRDVALSMKRTAFGGTSLYNSAKRWTSDSRTALAMRERYPDQVKLLRYEDLIANTESSLSQVVSFFRLAPCPDLHDRYLRHDDDVHHARSTLYKEPVSESSIGNWRELAGTREMEICETVCSELMRALSYPPALRQPSPPTITEKAACGLRDTFVRLTNRRYLDSHLSFARLLARRSIGALFSR